MLDSKGWARCNFRFLHKWLLEQRAKGVPEIAVFDFDNTCIFQDIGEAVLRWQLEHKAFRFDSNQLRNMVTPPQGSPATLHDGTPIPELVEQIVENFERMNAKDKDAQTKFILQLFYLYEEGTKTEGLGAPFTYLLCAQMLTGYHVDDIHKLVKHVAVQEGIHFGKTKTWQIHDDNMIGPHQMRYRMGLKAQPEIINLMHALIKARVTPYVVTASIQHIVAPLLQLWDYPVLPMHLFGIRLQKLGDILTEIPKPGYLLPIEEGKVELIKQELPGEPIFVAGDSKNDKPMLTSFDKTEVRLLLHRPGTGLDALYPLAAQEGHPPRSLPAVLLQGRNNTTGRFNQSTASE